MPTPRDASHIRKPRSAFRLLITPHRVTSPVPLLYSTFTCSAKLPLLLHSALMCCLPTFFSRLHSPDWCQINSIGRTADGMVDGWMDGWMASCPAMRTSSLVLLCPQRRGLTRIAPTERNDSIERASKGWGRGRGRRWSGGGGGRGGGVNLADEWLRLQVWSPGSRELGANLRGIPCRRKRKSRYLTGGAALNNLRSLGGCAGIDFEARPPEELRHSILYFLLLTLFVRTKRVVKSRSSPLGTRSRY
ncbi:hypothetical protein FN846DRAFT_48016 [Sphaerosporella brunnea]|uniref:Uncharacterized protein n=1 Tax=Sphaerosporella brunnea TaxID=1250544 RepID=A0A5J5EUB6_9PEZI|nr:hypothetical protein FN846DRAFT_48016 [Sphaerosporella brunnea]